DPQVGSVSDSATYGAVDDREEEIVLRCRFGRECHIEGRPVAVWSVEEVSPKTIVFGRVAEIPKALPMQRGIERLQDDAAPDESAALRTQGWGRIECHLSIGA